MPAARDDITSGPDHTVTTVKVGGHDAWLIQNKDTSIVVAWTTRSGAIFIKADGPESSRLTAAQLEAFAATVPTA